MSEQIVKEYSELLGRKPHQVAEDLKIVKKMVDDKVWAINEFFVKGKGWFYDPLVQFQIDGANRFFNGPDKQLEIWPRGHTKTTLFSRTCCALEAAMGISPYTVIFSSNKDNSKGTKEAISLILEKPLFRDLQWMLSYWNGPVIAEITATEIRLGNGSIIEFKSIFGESRGLNREGRPYRIHLDDVLPTESATSYAIREEVTDRYFSMIRPMGEEGSRISIVGTVMHRDDLLWKIARGDIEGFSVNVISAYDQETKEVAWPQRWTYEDLERIRITEYAKAGKIHLFKREFLSDPAESDTHPLQEYEIKTVPRVDKVNCYRVVSIDNAQGTGQDNFAIVETGQNIDGEIQILTVKYDNTWKHDRRIEESLKVLRHRKPKMLIVQKTSESITFIEQLAKAMKEEGIKLDITTPTWSKAGGKNELIHGWLEHPLSTGDIVAEAGETRRYRIPGIPRINDELHSFDVFSDRNMDDCGGR